MRRKPKTSSKRSSSPTEKIRRLVERLASTEASLYALTGGQLDAIIDRKSRSLLRQTQEALLQSEARDREARYREIQALQEISHRVLNSMDVGTAMEAILDQALSIPGLDVGAIRLFDSKGALLNVAARGFQNSEAYKRTCNPLVYPGHRAVALQVIATKRTVVIENLSGSPGLTAFKLEGLGSAILIPIKNEGEVLGIIQVGSRAPRKFESGEIRFLETIGSQMGVAVQKSRLHENALRNLEWLRALHEIDLAITATLNLRTVLNILLEKIDLFLPDSATTIRLFNKRNRVLEPVSCRHLNEEEWKAELWTLHKVHNIVFETRKPLMVLNLQTDPRTRDNEFFHHYRLLSYLGVPLIAKGDTLGVLGLYTKKEEHRFSDEEIEFFSTLAGQAAIAIYNSQLYEETKTAKAELESTNQRLEKSLKELSALHTALSPLVPADSINEMMDRIITRLLEATGADAALIRVRDNVLQTYPCVAHRGFLEFYLETVATAPPGGGAAWVFQNAQPIIASDLAAEPRFKGMVQLQVGFRSCAMLPLVVQREVRGIVHLASRELGYFNQEQEAHLMAIARQMGIALENRQLFDDLKTSRDELEKANKVKSEFLSVISHEVRTPLTSILGYAGMLKDKMFGVINQEQDKALGKVLLKSNELLDMISEILQATTIEAEAIKVASQEISLSHFLKTFIDDYDITLEKDLRVIWQSPSNFPTIKTDPEMLKRILQNLISNAIKFTDKGSITVSARVIDGRPETADGEARSPVVGPPSFLEFKVSDKQPAQDGEIVIERNRLLALGAG